MAGTEVFVFLASLFVASVMLYVRDKPPPILIDTLFPGRSSSFSSPGSSGSEQPLVPKKDPNVPQQGEEKKKKITFPENWGGWQPNRDDRYNHLLSRIQFHTLPNFTEVGYQVIEAPRQLFSDIRAILHARMESGEIPLDQPVNIIPKAPLPPVFYELSAEMRQRILTELQPLHEEWSHKSLIPSYAFGLRVYRSGNVLQYHVDRVETHVVSCIFHIDNDADEPWPIYIFNNTGHLNSVSLQPGQMLFYESARLMHGRPHPFQGSYYSSVFVHYRPTDWPFKHSDISIQLPAGWEFHKSSSMAEQTATYPYMRDPDEL